MLKTVSIEYQEHIHGFNGVELELSNFVYGKIKLHIL